MGDMGNITTDADGTATYDQTLDLIQLFGAKNVIGRAVVIHDATDNVTNGVVTNTY